MELSVEYELLFELFAFLQNSIIFCACFDILVFAL